MVMEAAVRVCLFILLRSIFTVPFFSSIPYRLHVRTMQCMMTEAVVRACTLCSKYYCCTLLFHHSVQSEHVYHAGHSDGASSDSLHVVQHYCAPLSKHSLLFTCGVKNNSAFPVLFLDKGQKSLKQSWRPAF